MPLCTPSASEFQHDCSSTSLTSDSQGVRSVTVRAGDTVRVIRGDFSHGGKRHGGKRKAEPLTGPVIGIDADKGRILIEGAKQSKSDNREEAVPVHASNVVVIKLDETDKLRVQKLTEDRS